MRNMKQIKGVISLVMALVTIFGILSMAGCSSGDKTPVAKDPVNDNYRSFYQIFVGSFSDSNGDGFGDLRGIINRFDYLNDGNVNSEKSLGVQGIWLSPIFSSPSYHKYDAKDYYKIDWRFGTEEDLKELIALCDERNVKLILDLAINHTSSSHPWFLEFKQARMNGDTENKYYDYYACVTTAEKKGGVTYQKIATVDCWFECNFSGDMPELNYDNPEVRAEMVKLAKYYLDLGIDGFRFDAVKYIYYGDTARSVDFWEWYMDELYKINPDIYCVGECWSGETEILQYYPAMNCFNFAMAQAEGVIASAAKGFSLSSYNHYLESFQDKVQAANPNGMIMPFLSNHDMDRIAGSFVNENMMRMAANLYILSPGSPVIYYGEEIGMRGSRGSAMTDANRRLAMLWGDDDMVRNPEGSTYLSSNQIQTTVKDQMKDPNSLYRHYCELLTVRHRYPAIARGDYKAVTTREQNLGGSLITYNGEQLLLLHNNSSEEITIDLSTVTALQGIELKKVCDYVGLGKAKLKGTVLTLGACTSVIIQ